MDALYFLTPIEESINLLLNEFLSQNKKTIQHTEVTTLKEMGEVMKAMPQFHDLKAKVIDFYHFYCKIFYFHFISFIHG